MMHPKSPPEKLEFNAFFGSLILLYAVCIGVEADLTDAEEDVGTKNLLKVIEVIFLTLFTLELAVRLVYRESLRDFVLDGWNLMDGILVCIGILDLLSAALDLREVTVLRILRLLKLYRLLRLLRFFKQLYLLVFGYIQAMRTLSWVFVLLTLIIYIFAILVKQLIIYISRSRNSRKTRTSRRSSASAVSRNARGPCSSS